MPPTSAEGRDPTCHGCTPAASPLACCRAPSSPAARRAAPRGAGRAHWKEFNANARPARTSGMIMSCNQSHSVLSANPVQRQPNRCVISPMATKRTSKADRQNGDRGHSSTDTLAAATAGPPDYGASTAAALARKPVAERSASTQQALGRYPDSERLRCGRVRFGPAVSTPASVPWRAAVGSGRLGGELGCPLSRSATIPWPSAGRAGR
jgi:hypothetical protein